tara:strand:+ start:3770 stop:3988 length:219 start_codon:yes stop_codon:yes gene_type:complete
MSLTKNETTEDGDPKLFSMTVGEEALDEILLENGIVPCHLHRNLATDRLKANALSWIRSEVDELAEYLRRNN